MREMKRAEKVEEVRSKLETYTKYVKKRNQRPLPLLYMYHADTMVL